MGFVKTAVEMERIGRVLANPRFANAETLQVQFVTEFDTLARVLPPPLKPGPSPVMTAAVGRWQSNCVGDYERGVLYASAQYGDIVANYVLAMYISTDAAIIFGRDLFGEPKKQATIGLVRHADRMAGWVERGGVRLMEVAAELGPDVGPGEAVGRTFNFKALPATDGDGLEGDAILTLAEFESTFSLRRTGTGHVALPGSLLDPLDEIEVRQVLGATYTEGNHSSHARNLCRVAAADYLPYYYGRQDDWSLLDTSRYINPDERLGEP